MIKNNRNDRAKVLVIDEDAGVFGQIQKALSAEGYRLYASEGAQQGMQMSASICPDLILMDIRLSGMEGTALIRWFRGWTDCPILVLSGEDASARKAESLYAGADDYIVKPFCGEELAARVYAILRRRIPCGQSARYKAQDLSIDFLRRQVLLEGEEIHFSPVEYRIIEYLALHSGTVVPYQMLLKNIWGPYADSGSRILRVNMTNIRKKIEKVPMDPAYIITIPRVGYRMLESIPEEKMSKRV